MDSRSSLNFGDDSAIAGANLGDLTSSIDNASFFRSAPPLAASTVARESRKRDQDSDVSSGGSFLDSEPSDKRPPNKLQLSFSAVDQSGAPMHPIGGDIHKSQSAGQIQQKDDESFQSMVSWGGMPVFDSSKVSSRDSSLGLIAVDKMSDLSASVLLMDEEAKNKENLDPKSEPLSTKSSASSLREDPEPPGKSFLQGFGKYTYTSLSQSLGKRTTPSAGAESDHSNQSSLQGSKHSAIDWSNNVETVKKRPSVPGTKMAPVLPVGGVRQSLFGCKGGALVEESEGDVTLPEVQFGDGELDQLDDDFGNFEATFNDSDTEQKELLPMENEQDRAGALDEIYLSASGPTNGEVNRLASMSSTREEDRTDRNKYPSLSKVNLFDEMGSTEDLISADKSKDSSMMRHVSKDQSSLRPQGAEGRDGQMDGRAVTRGQSKPYTMFPEDGSEIDTEDELEMARQQSSSRDMVRSEGAGQSLEAPKSHSQDQDGRGRRDDSHGSLMMRYSAEGDIVSSPVPGDGGYGGDGESDSDSESRRHHISNEVNTSKSSQAKEFIETFKGSFKGSFHSPSSTLEMEEERVRPMGDDLLREEGVNRYSLYQASMLPESSHLQSQYLLPMPLPADATTHPTLDFEESAYPSDDMLAQSQGVSGEKGRTDHPGDRLEASGFNINDLQDDNPFDRLQSSFGSFGASPSDRESQESHWTNVNMSPLSHMTSNRSQLSPARSSMNSVGSGPRLQGAGQSDQRESVQGQEDVEDNLRISHERISTENKQNDLERSNAEMTGDVPTTVPSHEQADISKEPRLSMYRSHFKPRESDSNRLSKSMPVKQNSEHSPVYQKDMGKKKQNQENQEEKDVVYRDSTGEYVTDLAFHISFADMVGKQQENLQQQFEDGALDFDPLHNDQDFKTSTDAKAMLDADEVEFEKENVFREDENITAASMTTPDSSWMVHSKVSCPSDIRDELGCGDDLVRISIGSFMKSRSGALGSLGGDNKEERPEFGMEIKTPPHNKKPYPLLEPSSERLSDIQEGEMGEARTSGVGDDEGFSPAANKTVTLSDLKPSVDLTPGGDSTLDVKGDNTLHDGDNEVFTPERSVNTSGNKKSNNETLNISEVSRAIASLPKGTCPKEMAKFVMSLSQNKRLGTQPVNQSKQTRLPVKKGSDVLTKMRVSSSTSPNVLLNKSSGSDKDSSSEKEKHASPASSLDRGNEARLTDLRMVGESANDMMEKSNPDGEESDRSISPISGSNSSSPSEVRVVQKAPPQPPPPLREGHIVSDTQEAYVRSPRSSTTVGLTGHHVPDGNDYSIVADFPHKVKMGMTREDLDGTEDIQMADSRGFDVIANEDKFKSGGSFVSQKKELGRSAAYVVHEDRTDSRENRNNRNTFPSQRMEEHRRHHQLKTSVRGESLPGHRDMRYRVRDEDAPSAVEKEQLDLHRQYEMDDVRLKVNATPKSPPPSQEGRELMHSRESRESHRRSEEMNNTASSHHSQSSGSRSPKHVVERSAPHTRDDRELMPPPPVPAPQQRSLPQQSSAEVPRLLTNQSLIRTDFAQHYLTRDAPRMVSTKPTSQYNIDKVTSQWDDQEFMVTPDQGRHRRVMSEPKEFSTTQHLENMSIIHHMPAYHSTPFEQDLSVMSQRFHQLENTLTTSTLAESRMSTGTYHETPHRPNLDPPKGDLGLTCRLSALEAPHTLRFPKVCCIGISTKNIIPLTNPSKRWLEGLVQISSLTIDGKPVNIDVANPFEFKPKVIVERNSTENLEVIFIPKMPGVYVAQLLINSLLFSKNRNSGPEKIPTQVTIQAIAEKPNIEVVGLRTDDHPVLDFGQVSWGSCTQLTINVINHGLASIPLRLAITSHRVPWHCFAFDRGPQPPSADISVISRSSRLQSPALGRTVMTLCVPGRGEEEDMQACEREIKVWCRPPDKHIDSSLQHQRPDEMTAMVKVEVDTPTTTLRPLEVIELCALVGFPRLHISKDLDILKCKASIGKKGHTSFTLKNVGNINLNVRFDILKHQDVVSVCPERLSIPPGDETSPYVCFLPLGASPSRYETLLLMHVEPDGPTYELDVTADVIPEQREMNLTDVILADRRFVAFGGVAVGKSLEKKVTILNQSNMDLKMKVEIRSHTKDFQIRSSSIHSTSVAESRHDLVIQPRERFPVYVRFSPSDATEQTGKLFIKPYGYTNRFSIPLTGYGGGSKLLLEGASIGERDRYVIDLGEISVGDEVGKKLTLRNLGVRAAYVKVKAFSDPSCRSASITSSVLIEPNDFVISQGEAKSVILLMNPTDREVAMCSCGRSVVSTVVFYCGDELMRQRFRRAYQKCKKPLMPKDVDSVVASLRFNQPFMGEEHVLETPAPPEIDLQNHIDKFYLRMTRLVVALVGAPRGYLATKTPQVHHHSPRSSTTSHRTSVPDRRKAAELGYTTRSLVLADPAGLGVQPVKDTSRDEENKVDLACSLPVALYGEGLLQEWTVKPDQLMIYVSSKDPENVQIQKFQIINMVDKKLRYSLSWPGQLLKLTPEGGTVEAKSSTTVCVSASAWVYQHTEELPCKADITVDCNYKSKVVSVQIRTDTPYNGTVDVNHRSHDLLAPPTSVGLSLHLPVCMSPGSFKQAMAKDLKFPTTKVGQVSETSIELNNTTDEPIHWIVTSFAPPYVKGADGGSDVVRALYKVFDFTEKFGCLTGGGTIMLKVQFMPRSKGTFTQCWDIESKKGSKATRIQLNGEAISDEVIDMKKAAGINKSAGVDHKDKKGHNAPDQPIIVDHEGIVKFSPCAPGQAQILKIAIKNLSMDNQTLEVIPPQPPFFVRHLAFEIKKKRYLKYPIEFRPVEKGVHQGLLIIKFGHGQTIDVRLEGLCEK